MSEETIDGQELTGKAEAEKMDIKDYVDSTWTSSKPKLSRKKDEEEYARRFFEGEQGKGLYPSVYWCKNERETTNVGFVITAYRAGDNADHPPYKYPCRPFIGKQRINHPFCQRGFETFVGKHIQRERIKWRLYV